MSIEGYVGEPVNLFEPEVGPQGELVTLRWNRFTGGRFEAYRVERFSLDVLDFEEIERISTVSDTLFIDPDPVPEVSRYRIVVQAAGETWSSNTSGRVRLLSPAVVLRSVDFDEREGSATLTWSRYAGESFLSYQIKRRIVGESSAELLDTIKDAEDTLFVDTGVEADWLYVYSVVVFISTSGAELPGDAMEASFALEPPQLQVSFDRETTSADLTWSRAVSGFDHYEIHRQIKGEEEALIMDSIQIEDTTFVDTELEENTEYTYMVVTYSNAGREVESAPVGVSTFPKLAF